MSRNPLRLANLAVEALDRLGDPQFQLRAVEVEPLRLGQVGGDQGDQIGPAVADYERL